MTTNNCDCNNPLVYEGGNYYLNNAFIGTLNAGNLYSADGLFNINSENGRITIFKEVEEETSFKTANHCEYSIFEDDENEETFHIEIDPTWHWGKEDILELIEVLKFKIGAEEFDVEEEFEEGSEGNQQKQLLIITAPGSISSEYSEFLLERTTELLDKANIDAIPLILDNGLNAYFEKPRA